MVFALQPWQILVVPTGFSRPNYYKKELELRMSCSYGPGRYDSRYEDQGLDYPIGYVRWTEKRNMQAFLELLRAKKMKLDKLVTHTFRFEDAEQAYQMIVEKTEAFMGLLLEYNTQKPLARTVEFQSPKRAVENGIQIGFIGAGAFAQNYLLPHVKEYGNLRLSHLLRPPIQKSRN